MTTQDQETPKLFGSFSERALTILILNVMDSKGSMSTIVLGVLTLFVASGKAQNLVPNASFEVHSDCPHQISAINWAVGWQPFRSTPDYYHACDQTNVVSVPENMFGYQSAATGCAYAGLCTYLEAATPSYREFMGVALTEPLVPGVPVYISFKAAPAAFGVGNHAVRWTIDRIGVGFSMTSYYTLLQFPLPNTASVFSQTVLTDTSAWTTISGVWVPDSAYVYALIGNFFDDANTTVVEIDPNGTESIAYTLIDDVCISYDPAFCSFPPIPCDQNLGAQEMTDRGTLCVLPNPFTDHIEVALGGSLRGVLRLELLDMLGREMATAMYQSSPRVSLDLPVIPDGLYLLRMRDGNGGVYSTRVERISP